MQDPGEETPTSPTPTAKDLAEQAGATPAAAAQTKLAIQRELEPFDAMHVLALLAEVGTRTPRSDDPLPVPASAVVEYLATILLERKSSEGSATPAADLAQRTRLATQNAIMEAENLTGRTILARILDSTSAKNPLTQLAADHAFREVLVRWPSYPHQERQALGALFGDPAVVAAHRAELGVDAPTALRLLDSSVALLQAMRVGLEAHMAAVIAEIVAAGGDLAAADERTRRQMQYVLELGPDLVRAWTIKELELCQASGVRWQAARGFLEMLASRYGDTKGTHLVDGRNQVRTRPFITDDGDRYLPLSLDNAQRALRPAFEKALPKEIFDRVYEPGRSAWAEQQASALLARALPGADIHRNLRFDLDGTDNLEVDVLVRLDHLCLVVEVKAGGLPARTTGRALRHALDGLLGNSTRQAGRLARAIAEDRSPAFRNRDDDQPVAVDLHGVHRVEPVVITLEDLGFLASRRRALYDLDLLTSINDVPWVVSVFDLEIMVDLSQHPAELTTYIAARRALDERVLPLDELELWLLHLDESLQFESVTATMISVQDRVRLLDDHLILGSGPAPAMTLKRALRRDLNKEEITRAPGWLARCEQRIAKTQARRAPTFWPIPSLDGFVACSPIDPVGQPRQVRDLEL